MDNIPAYLISFLITVGLIWLLQPVARFFGLVDKPGGRKKHEGSIPLIGGIAMYIGLFTAIALSGQPPLNSISSLLIGGGLLLLVGTVDDLIGLSPLSRFVTQISAALIMIYYGDIVLYDLGHLAGSDLATLGIWAVPLTVFATVGVINAVNMSDGMDGLAGGLVLVPLVCMGLMSGFADSNPLFYLFPALIIVIAAFLKFNLRTPWLKSATIFMGNGGSMLLGFIMAWLLIKLSQGSDAIFSPITAIWMFALPLFDTVCIMMRRILKGRSPFAPDREHFHHILLLAGYSATQTVGIMIGFSALLAVFGVAAFYAGFPESTMLAGILALFALYFWGMNHAWKVMKAIRIERPSHKDVDSKFLQQQSAQEIQSNKE